MYNNFLQLYIYHKTKHFYELIKHNQTFNLEATTFKFYECYLYKNLIVQYLTFKNIIIFNKTKK